MRPPSIYRKAYLLYKENRLYIINATEFEMDYIRRHIKEEAVKWTIVELRDNKSSGISFDEFIYAEGLGFKVGKLVSKRQLLADEKEIERVEATMIAFVLIVAISICAGLALLG
jgi:hypothetical protein